MTTNSGSTYVSSRYLYSPRWYYIIVLPVTLPVFRGHPRINEESPRFYSPRFGSPLKTTPILKPNQRTTLSVTS